MKAVEVIIARPSSRYSKDFLRKCKGCGRNIQSGELCVRYRRRHSSSYHCHECGKKYYPAVFDE